MDLGLSPVGSFSATTGVPTENSEGNEKSGDLVGGPYWRRHARADLDRVLLAGLSDSQRAELELELIALRDQVASSIVDVPAVCGSASSIGWSGCGFIGYGRVP